MDLSEHFTLEEMTFSQTAARNNIDNTPTEAAIENLTRLCALLEQVRSVCKKPITISSGYRSPEVNKLVGGANHSQHMQGCAADFTIKGMSLDDIIKTIVDANLSYDQLIKEFDGWIHISVVSFPWASPRKEVLIADKKGTRQWRSIS